MPKGKVIALPNVLSPDNPVLFNPDICNGCNHCVEVCQIDVFMAHPRKGEPPIILHPEECRYCGCCANECLRPGALTFNRPIQAHGYWKNKATGEIHQL